ncbi:MAG: F0F1 ATP synthase subunit A [Chloroflexi bacterium]|nr:F0F1 ATP synthase subunit A [Chloroflexota bacterium]MBM3174168.1 F0F1 ATP synthase subunit A [Chloroflexota bacterium]MBM4449236.1 F0F1 ATP synthase subunit A [Chloroflexota bacterium]
MAARGGCSMKIAAIVGIFILALFLTGLIVGPLGASLLGIAPPKALAVPKPHVELPSEGVAHLGSFVITNTLIASWLTIMVLAWLFYACTRKMTLVPGRLQSLAEMVVETLLNFITGVAGQKNARTLFPVVATIFLYVITNAYMGLLPFYGSIGINEVHEHESVFVPLLRAANTDVNVPLSIALVSFIFVEYLGFRAIGIPKYINSFFKFDQLRDGIVSLFKGKLRPAITGILFGFINIFVGCLEVFSHFIRIISFTFRLFGNMTAGEILLLVVCFLVPLIATIPFYGLELLIGFIQALIFAGLTLVFGVIALTPHTEEEHA